MTVTGKVLVRASAYARVRPMPSARLAVTRSTTAGSWRISSRVSGVVGWRGGGLVDIGGFFPLIVGVVAVVQSGGRQVQVFAVEVDPDVGAVQGEGGDAGRARAVERVQYGAGRWATGGDRA